MKIFADENVPLITIRTLTEMGCDVSDIRGTPDQGIKDEKLWQKVQDEKRLLITTDKGFTKYRREAHHGILIIRLKQPNRLKIHQRIMQAIKQHKKGKGLTVVMKDSVKSICYNRHKKF